MWKPNCTRLLECEWGDFACCSMSAMQGLEKSLLAAQVLHVSMLIVSQPWVNLCVCSRQVTFSISACASMQYTNRVTNTRIKYDMSIHPKLYVGYRSDVDHVMHRSYHVHIYIHKMYTIYLVSCIISHISSCVMYHRPVVPRRARGGSFR